MKASTVFIIPERLVKAVDEVDHLLAAGHCELVLDFTRCSFVSVDGLEWLEELLMREESLSAKVSFVNVHPTIYKVFKVARIESILRALGSYASYTRPVC